MLIYWDIAKDFSVYFSNLAEKLVFSTVKVPERTTNKLNKDLKEINKWDFKWKMSFKSDPKKQAQEVIFSRKTIKKIHPKMFVNDIPVSIVDSQKHMLLNIYSKFFFWYSYQNNLN